MPKLRLWALAFPALFALAAALALHRYAPPPQAQPGHGSEEAFGSGLYDRELVPGRGPQRWTGDRGVFRFRNLPPGEAALEVRIRGHRTPVAVLADGRDLGVIEVGRFVGRYALPAEAEDGRVQIELRTPGFTGEDGRTRGALVDRVRISPAPAVGASWPIVLAFLSVSLAMAGAALLAGLSGSLAALAATLVVALQAAALWPDGLLRSAYAVRLPWLLVASAAGALAAAGLAESRWKGAGRWAFAAALATLLVQGLAATSPLMVSSDVVFHANKLRDVAAGDYFPTSVTQHARPFRIPYGVSFYALLAPLADLGLDRVSLVRIGAAASGMIASAALFALLARSGGAGAALAVVLLQLLPAVFDPYSYGNLSNAFGQSLTVIFFAWWAGRAPGGWPTGALLVALASLAHLSSLIVLAAVVVALVTARGRALASDRTRWIALGMGFGLAALYYARFAPLVAEQVPRLLEGGGQGRGASRDSWDALAQQGFGALTGFGAPAIALALLGLARGTPSPLRRDLAAYGAGAAALLVPAVLSPLEVRFLYALTLPLAVLAAGGWGWLAGRGRAGAALAWALLAVQGLLAARNLVDAVAFRYRP